MTKRVEVQTPCLCGDVKCGSVDLTWCEVKQVGVDLSDITGGVKQYRVTIEPDELYAVDGLVYARDEQQAADYLVKRFGQGYPLVGWHDAS